MLVEDTGARRRRITAVPVLDTAVSLSVGAVLVVDSGAPFDVEAVPVIETGAPLRAGSSSRTSSVLDSAKPDGSSSSSAKRLRIWILGCHIR